MRWGMALVAAVLALPFVALAFAPMLLMLLPVAFVAIPIMVMTFSSAAHSNLVETARIRTWQPVLRAQPALAIP